MMALFIQPREGKSGREVLPPPRVLQKSGWLLEMRVQGESMLPLLKTGDTVSIRCLPADRIRTGDLICFQRSGITVLHRVLERRRCGKLFYYEKGDADNGGQWIDADHVVGRAELINGQPLEPSSRDVYHWDRIERWVMRSWRCLGWGGAPWSVSSRWRRCKIWALTRRKQRPMV